MKYKQLHLNDRSDFENSPIPNWYRMSPLLKSFPDYFVYNDNLQFLVEVKSSNRVKVKDLMHTKELPIVDIDDDFSTVIKKMTRGKLGLCIVNVDDTPVIGIITDGDLRRALESDTKIRFEFKARDMMTKKPKTISSNEMAIEAKNIMIKNKINELLVLDNDELVGIVQLYDMGVI